MSDQGTAAVLVRTSHCGQWAVPLTPDAAAKLRRYDSFVLPWLFVEVLASVNAVFPGARVVAMRDLRPATADNSSGG